MLHTPSAPWRTTCQVSSEPLDDFGSPPVLLLASQDIAADAPIKQHQFAVDGQCRPDLGCPDAFFEVAQEPFVSLS